MFKNISIVDVVMVMLLVLIFIACRDSKYSLPEINSEACIPITISGAGIKEHRTTNRMNYDVAVCMNDKGQAVIDNSYDSFVNYMIAENEEYADSLTSSAQNVKFKSVVKHN